MYAETYRKQLPARGKMEFLVFLALAGWGGFKLFKLSSAMGGEALRAYIFLESLLNDVSLRTAQEMASRDMADLPTEIIQRIRQEIASVHGGKQTPLIVEAYNWGMTSKIPSWYRSMIELKGTSLSVELTYTMPLRLKDKAQKDSSTVSAEWVRPFVTYTILNQLRQASQWPNAAGRMTENLIGLAHGAVTLDLQTELPVSLRLYMAFAYPHVTRFGLGSVVKDAQSFLTEMLQFLSTDAALEEYLQTTSVADNGRPMTFPELKEAVIDLKKRMPKIEDTQNMLRDTMLQMKVEEIFEKLHGRPFSVFLKEMLNFEQDAEQSNSVPAVVQHMPDTFGEYYRMFLAELKRLAGTPDGELHVVELMEDEGTMRAFRDGVPPRQLAEMVHKEFSAAYTRTMQ